MTHVKNPATAPAPESYPRQRARTRGFQLGRPRSFHITDSRVLFIRSTSGSDSAGSLWSLDLVNGGAEECIVDVRSDIPSASDEDLPAAERARRERMREVTGGITAFSVDDVGVRAAFAVGGSLYAVELDSRTITALPSPGPAVDPRMNASGTRVSFVCEQSLYVVNLRNLAQGAVCLAQSQGEDESWGLADFIAAEELSRFRGHWWLADGESLLVERTDTSPVAQWWIADPANPTQEPHAVRYPGAGTANAALELWHVGVGGDKQQITWNSGIYPYVASIHMDDSAAIVELLTRDQRTVSICRVDLEQQVLVEIQSRTDAAWIDVMPGVPCLDEAGQLLEILADHETDTYRLARADRMLTPAGLQVRALLAHDETSAVVAASASPTAQALYRVSFADGSTVPLTDEGSWSGGTCTGSTSVTVAAQADTAHSTFTVVHENQRFEVANLAETPHVEVRPTYAQVGSHDLESCILWPTGHVPGSRRLPVVLSPYGGPHGQRVMRNAAAFTTEQWFADQGFAVIVADGRGTPGRGPGWERSVLDDLATHPVADQVEALHALATVHPDLDTSRVGIRGWSFGGYLAALAVLERPDVFHAAVAGAPVTDWQLYDTAYTERYLGDPNANPDAYARTSLLSKADKLRTPLLLIHGIADDNVFVAHTLQFSGALLAAGKPHAVVPLSGVTHMTPQEVVAENLLRLEVDFFREHLGDHDSPGQG
ncbi:MAG: prolyl oligopeptidase family serine peptidase [Candidatus Nanopelagicales bacterium]